MMLNDAIYCIDESLMKLSAIRKVCSSPMLFASKETSTGNQVAICTEQMSIGSKNMNGPAASDPLESYRFRILVYLVIYDSG